MLFLSIEIANYKRFPLGMFKKLHINFAGRFQLVLGTNGSGKSSLMREISVLPSDYKDFYTDGYKIVTLSHRSRQYRLVSDFRNGEKKYQFFCDDENLNVGDNITGFKELARQHFNVTAEIMDVMTGIKNFTSMSVAERRRWLIDISQADYSFALRYHAKLCEELRDCQGSIKRNQNRLILEKEAILTPEAEAYLQEQSNKIHNLIMSFVKLRGSGNHNPHAIAKSLEQTNESLMTMSRNLVEASKKLAAFSEKSNMTKEALEEERLTLSAQIAEVDTRIELMYERINFITQQISKLEHEHIGSAADLDNKLDLLAMQIAEAKRGLVLSIEYHDPILAANALKGAIGGIVEAIGQLKPNLNGRYTRSGLEALKTDLRDVRVLLTSLDLKQKETLKIIEAQKHLATHAETECPKCEHKWVIGYDPALLKRAEANLEKQTEEYKAAKLKLEELEVREVDYMEYAASLNNYRRYVSANIVLEPLFIYLDDNNLILEDPYKAKDIVQHALNDLITLVKIKDLETEFNSVTEIKTLANESSDLDMHKLQTEADERGQEVLKLHARQKELLDQRNENRLITNLLETVQSLRDKIKQTLNGDYKKLKKDLDQHLVAMDCDRVIGELEIERTRISNLISKQQMQTAVVRQLETEIASLEEESKLLKLAVDELSPKEGLIAKGLTGFINHFVARCNSIIKKIWLYPLVIVPVEIKNGELELDYKFKMVVNDKLPVADISIGSSAMQEIVNLAAKIASMQYLGMSDYPLYLDEFGSKMDPMHREAAFNAITTIIASADFSQIFMISHHEQSYGSLTDCNLVVLDRSNVILPTAITANSNVVMS